MRLGVFISWSGERSRQVATTIAWWLPRVLPGVKPWMSEKDILKGDRWSDPEGKQLAQHRIGIICVTPENKSSEWLLFEAGAISKTVGDDARVCPLLFGIVAADLDGPLNQFQVAVCNGIDLFSLVSAINRERGEDRVDDAILRDTFDKFWPELEARLGTIENLPHRKASVPEAITNETSITAVHAKDKSPFESTGFRMAVETASTVVLICTGMTDIVSVFREYDGPLAQRLLSGELHLEVYVPDASWSYLDVRQRELDTWNDGTQIREQVSSSIRALRTFKRRVLLRAADSNEAKNVLRSLLVGTYAAAPDDDFILRTSMLLIDKRLFWRPYNSIGRGNRAAAVFECDVETAHRYEQTRRLPNTYLAEFRRIRANALRRQLPVSDGVFTWPDDREFLHSVPTDSLGSKLDLQHFAVHLILRRSDGAIALQLRSSKATSNPGKLTSSVSGHIDVGDLRSLQTLRKLGPIELPDLAIGIAELEKAILRETREELGIHPNALNGPFDLGAVSNPLGTSGVCNAHTFLFHADCDISPCLGEEVDKVIFATAIEISQALENGHLREHVFAANFGPVWKAYRTLVDR